MTRTTRGRLPGGVVALLVACGSMTAGCSGHADTSDTEPRAAQLSATPSRDVFGPMTVSASPNGRPPLTINAAPSGGDKGTVLLLWDAHVYLGTMSVTGTFGVDRNGCFVIGDRLVEAAIGSHIVDHGRAVRVRSVGTLHVGDRVMVTAESTTLANRHYPDAKTCLAGRASAPVLMLDSTA